MKNEREIEAMLEVARLELEHLNKNYDDSPSMLLFQTALETQIGILNIILEKEVEL